MSAIERLGAALCRLSGRHLGSGVTSDDSGAVLLVPAVDYDGLTDAMFHMIRQNAKGATPVIMRMLEAMTAVADCERDAVRLATLQRPADLVLADGTRDIETPGDLADLRKRHATFMTMRCSGPSSLIGRL